MVEVSWAALRGEGLAGMDGAERAEHDAAALEAEARLQLVELAYGSRERHKLQAFEITADHFVQQYGTRSRSFAYNSRQLYELEQFSSDAGIRVMIINIQAFNATGKDKADSTGCRNISMMEVCGVVMSDWSKKISDVPDGLRRQWRADRALRPAGHVRQVPAEPRTVPDGGFAADQ